MFIFATDMHLSDKNPINRIDNTLDNAFIKLEEVFKLARKHQCEVILGGDLFDDAQPSYILVNRLIDLINKYCVVIRLVLGNHDLEGNNTDFHNAAIFTLLKSERVHLLSESTYDNIIIRGISYDNIKNYKAKDYTFGPEHKDKFKIIVTHNAICSTGAPYDHRLITDIYTDANLVLCGHIHCAFEVKHNETWFVNPGCLSRRKVNEKNIIPKVYLFKNKSIEAIELKEVKNAAEVFRDNIIKESDIGEFNQSIKDVKIEIKDIEILIYNQKDASDEVKNECISRVRKAKEKIC